MMLMINFKKATEAKAEVLELERLEQLREEEEVKNFLEKNCDVVEKIQESIDKAIKKARYSCSSVLPSKFGGDDVDIFVNFLRSNGYSVIAKYETCFKVPVYVLIINWEEC